MSDIEYRAIILLNAPSLLLNSAKTINFYSKFLNQVSESQKQRIRSSQMERLSAKPSIFRRYSALKFFSFSCSPLCSYPSFLSVFYIGHLWATDRRWNTTLSKQLQRKRNTALIQLRKNRRK